MTVQPLEKLIVAITGEVVLWVVEYEITGVVCNPMFAGVIQSTTPVI